MSNIPLQGNGMAAIPKKEEIQLRISKNAPEVWLLNPYFLFNLSGNTEVSTTAKSTEQNYKDYKITKTKQKFSGLKNSLVRTIRIFYNLINIRSISLIQIVV